MCFNVPSFLSRVMIFHLNFTQNVIRRFLCINEIYLNDFIIFIISELFIVYNGLHYA